MASNHVPKNPPLPVHTPADGNPFDWILAMAKRVREQRRTEAHRRWAEQETERRNGTK